MTHPRRLLIATMLVSALVASATACTPDDPQPTPTPTATSPAPTPTTTPTPTPDAQQQLIDEAKATYERYIEDRNEVEQASMAGWEERILPYLGTPELAAERRSYYEQAIQQGLRQTGEQVIASLTVTNFASDPSGSGFEQITLEACLDNGGVDIVTPEGQSVLLPGYPTRLITEAVLQRQGNENATWALSSESTKEDRPC
jgi:hypothetical protein